MGFTLCRTKAVIRRFRSDHHFWVETRLFLDQRGDACITTHYRNPELAGIWELKYVVVWEVFFRMQLEKLIESTGTFDEDGNELFVLTEKGKARL